MLTCNAVGLCGGSPGDWLRLFSRLTHADNRKREPIRCATLRHAPTDLPANYILAHYITWLFAIIFKWNGRAARTRRRRRRRRPSSLIHYVTKQFVPTRTVLGYGSENVKKVCFLFFYTLVLPCNEELSVSSTNLDLVGFFSVKR